MKILLETEAIKTDYSDFPLLSRYLPFEETLQQALYSAGECFARPNNSRIWELIEALPSEDVDALALRSKDYYLKLDLNIDMFIETVYQYFEFKTGISLDDCFVTDVVVKANTLMIEYHRLK